MRYKIRPSCYTGEWVVEVWEEEEGKGELYLVAFSGPFAEKWADEYVVLKEGHVQQSVAAAWIQEQSTPASNGTTRGSLSLTRLASGGEVPNEPQSRL